MHGGRSLISKYVVFVAAACCVLLMISGPLHCGLLVPLEPRVQRIVVPVETPPTLSFGSPTAPSLHQHVIDPAARFGYLPHHSGASTAHRQDHENNAACHSFSMCAPLLLRSGSLFVQLRPDGQHEPHVFRAGPVCLDPPVTTQPLYSFPPAVNSVVIVVGGVKERPHRMTDFLKSASVGLLIFEHRRDVLVQALQPPEIRKGITIESSRVFGFPATVGRSNAFTSNHSRSDAPCKPSPSTHSSTISSANDDMPCFPVIRAVDIARFVHPHEHTITLLAIDTQGTRDLRVAASFGQHLRRMNMLLLACHDVPPDQSPLDAFTCAEIRHCLEYQLPHRLVSHLDGAIGDTCAGYSSRVNTSARHCLFRKPDVPFVDHIDSEVLSHELGAAVALRIQYGMRNQLRCSLTADL